MFSNKTLRNIFITSCAIAIIYPLVNFYIIFPSFTNLLVKFTEEESIHVAQNLSTMVITENQELVSRESLPFIMLQAEEKKYIEKIKVFSSSGEVLYSTTPEDVGKNNTKDYFARIVAKGNVHTKVVQKDTKTLEGRKVSADVVETYVPIMAGDKFLGAFEIYFEITSRSLDLNNVVFKSAIVSFALVFGFFIIIITVLFRAEKAEKDHDGGNLSVIYHSPFYLLLITFLSIFSAEAVVMFIITPLAIKSKYMEAALDSALLVMLVSPLLYFFLMRPLTIHASKRRQAENDLQKAHDSLEVRVTERTSELEEAYNKLKVEVRERILAEERMMKTLNHLNALRTIDRAIIDNADLRITLDTFLEQVSNQLKSDALAILVLNQSTQMLEFVNIKGFSSNVLKHKKLKVARSIAGQAVVSRQLVKIPDMGLSADGQEIENNIGNERFVSYFAMPLIARGVVKGVLELFHRTEFKPDHDWIELLEAMSDQGAIAIDNATMFDELQRSNVELFMAYDSTIEGWSRAMDLRDKETEGHSQRVAEMALTIALDMGIKDEDLVHIKRGALLHDIGKMGIPDHILLKPGPLTEEESNIMKLHPVYANEMLAPIEYLEPALDIPLSHHEKWDGTGYPNGLKGKEIPLAARIFAVVDIWDALRSVRPYRLAWPERNILEYLRSLSGSHLDPDVLEIFLKIMVLNNKDVHTV